MAGVPANGVHWDHLPALGSKLSDFLASLGVETCQPIMRRGSDLPAADTA